MAFGSTMSNVAQAPLVLLHGNGSMIQDFESSGLIDLAARNYRVIVFDRPGFGHSDRPRNVVWTPAAQAELINSALERLGVAHAIVLGHSWGASVAVALALNYPRLVQGLVLASGYYYPTLRPDVVALSTPAIPVVGDVLRYTLSPMISRLIWPPKPLTTSLIPITATSDAVSPPSTCKTSITPGFV